MANNQLDKSPGEKDSLGLTRDLVERATRAGVNVPVVAEKLRGAITCRTNKGNTTTEILCMYDTLFGIMKPIMLEYGSYDTMVHVGDDETDQRLVLDQSGVRTGQTAIKMAVRQVFVFLYQPGRIIHNFMTTIIEAAEGNRNKIEDLENALRSVKTVSDDAQN
jgi:hypothetical protein